MNQLMNIDKLLASNNWEAVDQQLPVLETTDPIPIHFHRAMSEYA